MIDSLIQWFERWILCEVLLEDRANSGAVILLRSSVLALLVYIPVLITVAAAQKNAVWLSFDPEVARALFLKTLPWFGAIFGAIYFSLYARFSSQWAYLANLYNQIMQASVDHPPQPNCEHTARLRIWQAAFVEDAVALHLAAKPVFASAISDMLRHDLVRTTFSKHHMRGDQELAKVLAIVARAGHPVTLDKQE